MTEGNAYKLTLAELYKMAKEAALQIVASRPDAPCTKIYGVPRGGVPVSYLIAWASNGLIDVVDEAQDADVIVDDLIDSGITAKFWCERYPGKQFVALLDKSANPKFKGRWVVFPWEGNVERGICDHVRRIIEFVGDDPNRGGLLETPERVAKAWRHWCGGYSKSPEEVLKTFDDGAEKYDQMVTVRDIPFYSHCEHHLAPFFGTATVAYIPDGKIVGLSKISRLVDIFARRLQVQERLTNQVADALQQHLCPLGVGVFIKARHLCMESRGICQQGHHTVTTALRGVLADDTDARTEFLRMCE